MPIIHLHYLFLEIKALLFRSQAATEPPAEPPFAQHRKTEEHQQTPLQPPNTSICRFALSQTLKELLLLGIELYVIFTSTLH